MRNKTNGQPVNGTQLGIEYSNASPEVQRPPVITEAPAALLEATTFEKLFAPVATGASDGGAIPGLQIFYEVISGEEERLILGDIDDTDWQDDLERRVQQYGYKYDYKARRVKKQDALGPFPFWLQRIVSRLCAGSPARQVGTVEVPARAGRLPFQPDQVIINEYLPGQGIAAHIDCEPCFGDTIVSLSLGSACTMDFTEVSTGKTIVLHLPRRSMVIMSGEARSKWKHGIAKRKADDIGGIKTPRRRRVSLTFRKVALH